MNDIRNEYRPFKIMTEVCIALKIKSMYINIVDVQIILNKYFKKNFDKNELIDFYNRTAKFSDFFPKDFIKKFKIIVNDIKNCCDEAQYFHLPTEVNFCTNCNEILNDFTKETITAEIYFHSKPAQKCKLDNKKCKNCQTINYFSFAVLKNVMKRYHENSMSQRYIAFTKETVFEIMLLKSLSLDISCTNTLHLKVFYYHIMALMK